jgi:hypothetical protein
MHFSSNFFRWAKPMPSGTRSLGFSNSRLWCLGVKEWRRRWLVLGVTVTQKRKGEVGVGSERSEARGRSSCLFIRPRMERSGRRQEQAAASVGFNGATISVPKGNGEEGKRGAGEMKGWWRCFTLPREGRGCYMGEAIRRR